MTRVRGFLGLLVLLTNFVYGQSNCSSEKLMGHWRQVQTIYGVHSNVDSLKNLITKSDRTIGTLEMAANGTYNYKFLDSTNKKYHKYFLDTLTCEIILGTRRNARQNSNLKIIYLDDQFLIFSEDNNPKGDVTHLNTKLERKE